MDLKDQIKQQLPKEPTPMESFIQEQVEINRQIMESLSLIMESLLIMSNPVVTVEPPVPSLTGKIATQIIVDDPSFPKRKDIFEGCTTKTINIRKFGKKIKDRVDNPLDTGSTLIVKQLVEMGVLPEGSLQPFTKYYDLGYFRDVKSKTDGTISAHFTEAGQKWFCEMLGIKQLNA